MSSDRFFDSLGRLHLRPSRTSLGCCAEFYLMLCVWPTGNPFHHHPSNPLHSQASLGWAISFTCLVGGSGQLVAEACFTTSPALAHHPPLLLVQLACEQWWVAEGGRWPLPTHHLLTCQPPLLLVHLVCLLRGRQYRWAETGDGGVPPLQGLYLKQLLKSAYGCAGLAYRVVVWIQWRRGEQHMLPGVPEKRQDKNVWSNIK